MKTFNPAQFSTHLLNLVAGEALALHEGLKIVAKTIKNKAKKSIGHYQSAVGNFPAWATLKDSTLAEKTRLGYSPPDNPLLRTGEMRDSISYEVKGLTAVIGSTDQKAVWHELGTSKMAMRPFLGPAAFRSKRKIQEILGAAVVSGFYGKTKLGGYNFKIDDEK